MLTCLFALFLNSDVVFLILSVTLRCWEGSQCLSFLEVFGSVVILLCWKAFTAHAYDKEAICPVTNILLIKQPCCVLNFVSHIFTACPWFQCMPGGAASPEQCLHHTSMCCPPFSCPPAALTASPREWLSPQPMFHTAVAPAAS